MTTVSKAEIKRLYEQSLAYIQPDTPDPDPIIRLFNERKLAPDARLRQIYRAKCEAEKRQIELEAVIAEAEAQLYHLRAEHQQLLDQAIERRVLPDDDLARRRTALAERARLINECLDVWKVQLSGDQRLGDLSKQWDREYGEWVSALWRATGDQRFQPPMVVVHDGESAWQEPAWHIRQSLDQDLARLEA